MIEYNGREIIIMACSSCNLDCDHCYISYSGNRDPDELLEMVKKLKEKYSLNINGAELLTNIDYLKSLEEIGQTFFMSNGKMILENPSILDTIKSHGIKSISLSYHFGIQDDISRVSTEELNTVISLIQEQGLQVRLMSTITSKNYNMILEMCDRAFELKARGIKFTNFLSQGNAINLSNENILTEEQRQEFFKQLSISRQKYDICSLLIERCGTFGKNPVTGKDNFCCDIIDNSVVITPDNNVYPCVFLTKPGFEIGKYENSKIMLTDDIEREDNICLASAICNEKRKLKRLSKEW